MNGNDLINIVNTKREKTESLLRTYDGALDIDKQNLAETYKDMARLKNYKNNYIAVNLIKDDRGTISLSPVFNNLVMVNEIRAFRIQQIDYADRFAVFSTIHNKLTSDNIVNQEVIEFFDIYKKQNTFFRKMQLLCEYGLSEEAIHIVLDQIGENDSIKSYYTTLGPQRLRALSYNKTFIEKALGIVMFSPDLLMDSVYSDFKEGEKLSLTNIKNRLSYIYSSINYNSTPKATDIERWFEVKECLVSVEVDGKKKRSRGYELLRSKEHELREELKLTE